MPANGDQAQLPPPTWLAEEAWLRQLLGWFLDRLEQPRSRAVTRRVTRSTLPPLFRFDGEADYRWQLLERLASEYRVFTIRYARTSSAHQERYENAQLRLNSESEDLLRHWLGRPRIDPVQAAWRAAVMECRDRFDDGGAALLAAPIVSEGYEPGEIVRAFAAVGGWLDRGLTLREIAARCFRGDSKFLDGRQDLLAKCFGRSLAAIESRPLLLIACAPPGFERLLIVENQDSFLRLASRPPRGHALLYSGGFRASAQRLTSKSTRFAFLPGSDSDRFGQLWLNPSLPVNFWGDLDFSGMAILKALRHSLPALAAWRQGYVPMFDLLQSGGGHSALQAGKTGQADPGDTGCDYADTVLLPALRQYRRCVDQEWFAPDR
ncbi:hypothetical protein DWB85_01385 [Seongchinamella sediminis]|uniref:Wadjet protein JetD C-terminal domain-containing protein n=1 Tax=Seongchinamella sediminis TaxID=2283635 RepID=A0A3L7E5E6_9GAMM|nr:Wadjet anti-phage system protein JetD domain-containing protein [Seongchinamella sediminis]RLQ23832.1 hypothetical protein DWB85_01385 [Seongchinamella sediminis]